MTKWTCAGKPPKGCRVSVRPAQGLEVGAHAGRRRVDLQRTLEFGDRLGPSPPGGEDTPQVVVRLERARALGDHLLERARRAVQVAEPELAQPDVVEQARGKRGVSFGPG